MSDWKDLDVNNLPPDILVDGAWDIEWHDTDEGLKRWKPNNKTDSPFDSIRTQIEGQFKHRIRRPKPEALVHKERCEMMASNISCASGPLFGYRSDAFQKAMMEAVDYLLRQSAEPGATDVK